MSWLTARPDPALSSPIHLRTGRTLFIHRYGACMPCAGRGKRNPGDGHEDDPPWHGEPNPMSAHR
ncbi:hypothetical protein TPAR_02505 [Tolypocladium paradoxum]|uniref:Uncharacterized protein n=1 Tax=Tolypocladium paradoxum TaxID=94208 RepID=A0A2S4L4C2_9HYPO|nr:hypothetical protein TPAR_02505 [Tolypocladium paradoxum]